MKEVSPLGHSGRTALPCWELASLGTRGGYTQAHLQGLGLSSSSKDPHRVREGEMPPNLHLDMCTRWPVQHCHLDVGTQR